MPSQFARTVLGWAHPGCSICASLSGFCSLSCWSSTFFSAQQWPVHAQEQTLWKKSLQSLKNLIHTPDHGKDHSTDPDFHWMETSNPFLHLWYRWTPLTASPLRVNVVYRRYTGYRSILDPAAGILTGQPTNEVTSILRPPAQAQRRIIPNTPMGIKSTITSSNLSNEWKELIYLKNTICKRAVNI